MKSIKVNVAWCDKNFGDEVPGAVVFTARTFSELKRAARDTLEFHVAGLVEDGVSVPEWLAKGDHEFEYCCADAAALLHVCEPYVSLAAISRASGINQGLLSHCVNGVKKPGAEQRRRIVRAAHDWQRAPARPVLSVASPLK